MGRSFYGPRAENTIEDYGRENSYYHAASDTHFAMIRRDGKYYQRRYQIGYQGKEINVEEKQIDFVMGSGNHARTYLHRTGRNILQQLPLGWYSEKGGYWGMSPGYDHPDHEYSLRQITYDCMFCHNAYPKITNQENGAEPVFEGALPEGIDCQRCHGPGARHIAIARSGGARQADVRAAIVNPARLSPERAMDVCAQCHLQTSTIVLSHSMLRPGRGPFSYLPGEPLGAFRLTFDRPAESAARFEIVSSVYRLRQSACFVKSAGKLRCTSCHDPHDAAAKRYNTVCGQCHGSGFDRLVATGKHTSSVGCIDCHMPKRRTDDVVHAVMTDHYIQRRKPERDLLAGIAERAAERSSREELVAYDPKLGRTPLEQLDLAVAQAREVVNRNTGILRLSRLVEQYRPERAHYYVELADALYATGEYAKALPFYEEAVRRMPASTVVQQKLGAALMETGRFERAEALLKRANPGGWRLLGQVYARQGKDSEAAAAFQKAVNEDPDLPEVRNNLGSILAAGGDLAGAEREFRESMRMQPNLAEARSNLARVLFLTKDFRQAAYYFESAIRLKPDATNLRLELGAAVDMLKTMADGK